MVKETKMEFIKQEEKAQILKRKFEDIDDSKSKQSK